MKSVLATCLAMFLCIFLAISCDKNSNRANHNIKEKSLLEHLGKSIKVDIIGKVLDNNKNPIDNVTIIVGNKTTSTDRDGNFILKNASGHENLLSVEAKKDGYKNTLINLTPKENTNTVDITLHKETELCLFWFCKDNHNLK